MKANIRIFSVILGLSLLGACYREDKLDVDISNYDMFVAGEIDDWISANLTDPYNIEVVYRYQRNMHGLDRNISPPDESKVIPQMSVVLNAFLKLYEKVGGATFIKTYTPKQFALFGSGNYEPDGSVVAGTADAGRRITLYGLNGLDTTNAGSVLGNLGVIHHEFTHIINQMALIPAEFEQVCVGDYYANWTNQAENSQAISRSLGFITSYARKNPGEDFAETLSTLICSGQLYYDKYAFDSGEEAYEKMKEKESIVRNYMMQNFNIDVTELQLGFEQIMRNNYGSTAFEFGSALDNNYIGQIGFEPYAAWASEIGISSSFKAVYDTVVENFDNTGYPLAGVRFNYQSSEKVTLNVLFGVYTGAYDFDVTKNDAGNMVFALSAEQGEGTVYNNGAISWVKSAAQPLLDYLEGHEFVPSWFPEESAITTTNYLKYGGFYVADDPDNYFFGAVTAQQFN